ncbi:MAG: nitrophenyl compound nitroreductase subunit ArsF family protein [Candidatus Syntropharchaeia archaeon]
MKEKTKFSKDIKIYYFSLVVLIIFGIYMLFPGNTVSETPNEVPPFSELPDSTIMKNPDHSKVDKVIIALLHGNHRCTSCINMENWTEKTIETYFSKEREEGKIKFLVLNYEDPQNEEIVDRYSEHPFVSIYSETIVNGVSNIEEIEDAWFYQTDKEKFIEFMKNYIEGLVENDQ